MALSADNNAVITFDQNMQNTSISNTDLYLQVYGSEPSYEFEWTAVFTSETTISVTINYITEITGQEELYVEFPITNQIRSFSNMSVELDTYMIEKLGKIEVSSGAVSFGQTTLLLFVSSIFVTVISSFGGNSMEMFWKFTNTLQLIYFMSMVNVYYPDALSNYFPYLQISSADNPFFRTLSYLIVSDEHFTRGDINDKMGAKSFYVSCADKLPIAIPLLLLFIFIKLFDFVTCKEGPKCIQTFRKFLTFFKWDFYIRIAMELTLELSFGAMVNIIDVSEVF